MTGYQDNIFSNGCQATGPVSLSDPLIYKIDRNKTDTTMLQWSPLCQLIHSNIYIQCIYRCASNYIPHKNVSSLGASLLPSELLHKYLIKLVTMEFIYLATWRHQVTVSWHSYRSYHDFATSGCCSNNDITRRNDTRVSYRHSTKWHQRWHKWVMQLLFAAWVYGDVDISA